MKECIQVFEERWHMKKHAFKRWVRGEGLVKERENGQEWWWADQVSLLVWQSVKERNLKRQREKYGQIQKY